MTNVPSLIYEEDSSIPLLHASVVLRQGTTLDPVGKEGATQLLLRLMRKTAGSRKGDEVELALDAMGAALGADAHRSHAGFSGITISRHASRFFDLLAEILANSELPEVEFRQVKREMEAELVDLRDDDSSLVRRFFSRRFYRGHPYERLPGGTLSSLTTIQLDDLRKQKEKLFRQGNLVLCSAGDGHLAQLENRSAKMKDLLSAQGTEQDPLPEAPGLSGRSLLFVDKPARAQTQILIGAPGTHPTDADHTAFFVGHTIFGGTFSARLSQEVRAKRGWSYGAYSHLPYSRPRQPFSLWTFPKASDARACIELELDMLDQLHDRGVTKKELAQAKKYLARSHAFSVDTAGKRVGRRLESLLFGLPKGYHENYLDRIASVTLDEVNEALRHRVRTKDLLITVVGTHSEIGDEVAKAIPHLAENEIVPYDTPD